MTHQDTEITTPATPRRPNKRGLKTERKFIEAADKLFLEHGFHGTGIMQIVETAGLSVGSFYNRFADKEALLAVAAHDIIDRFYDFLEKIDCSQAKNKDLFTLYANVALWGRYVVSNHRGFYRVLVETNDAYLTSHFSEMAKIFPELTKKIMQNLPDYSNQLSVTPTRENVIASLQVLSMSFTQKELGRGVGFPDDPIEFAKIISRAACGILRYTGQTDEFELLFTPE